MHPAKTAAAYDQIADRWTSETFNRANGIAQHERAIAFLNHRRHALDVGCGSSGRIIDLLSKHGFKIEGIDISERMIALARTRHPDVRFHHADISEWAPTQQYDLISAWDSTWHLPLGKQEPVLRKILGALTPGGVCIFTTGGLDSPEEKTDSAMGPEVYYSVLGIPRTLRVLDEAHCICRHLEYDQFPERHLYIIAQKS